jgi:putative oxidoreductase
MKTKTIGTRMTDSYEGVAKHLNNLSNVIPPLILRVILAWEFGKAGLEKLKGSNWFTEIDFPFPFNLISPEISWGMATYFELFGAIALLLGIATRFFSVSLIILTVVAISAVHWPEQYPGFVNLLSGFRVIDEAGDGYGNYELPVLFLVMLLPLLFGGAGKISFDYIASKRKYNSAKRPLDEFMS